jgi:hypothetical protein
VHRHGFEGAFNGDASVGFVLEAPQHLVTQVCDIPAGDIQVVVPLAHKEFQLSGRLVNAISKFSVGAT